MKDRVLQFGHLGNGLTIWDRNNEVNGYYETVAHISADRRISLRANLNLSDVLTIIRVAKLTDAKSTFEGSDSKIFTNDAEDSKLAIKFLNFMKSLEDDKALKHPIFTIDDLNDISSDYASAWGADIDGLSFDDWWSENKERY